MWRTKEYRKKISGRGAWALRVLAVAAMIVWAAAAYAGDKIAAPDLLLSKIQQEGSVRVIMKIATPGYETLANASQRYKALAPNQTAAPQQRDADRDLAAAIKGAADTVLDRMPKGAVQKIHVFSTIPYVVASIDRQGLDALFNDPAVLHVEEDQAVPPPKPIPSESKPDPGAINSNLTQIGATNAWAQGYTGSGWYVAILDTGIRRTHEFFAGKTIVEACFTSKYSTQNPTATLCPNGTGEMTGTGAAAHYSTDTSWHGTHVAGIAAGKKADGSLAGVAKDASIVAVQVFSDGFTGRSSILSYSSDQLRGLEYVYSIRGQYSIASANMSIGGYQYTSACDSDSRKAIIDNLRSVGIATAIASGNDGYCGSINAPGCISTAVTVGAVDSTDTKASFSNWQSAMVPLFAPGVGINSSTGATDTSYAQYSGTSMATPHVAGAWVLAKQKMSSAGVDQVLTAFTGTAKNVTFTTCSNPTGITKRVQVDDGLGRLNPVTATQADVLWRNTSDGRAVIWFMDGVSRLGWSNIGSVANSWAIGGLGDYNNDGKKDILWRNASSGQNVVWYMSAGARIGWDYLDSLSGDWVIVGGGDFNADGKDDILLRRTSTGQNVVWYMDGKTSIGIADLPYAATKWSVVAVADFNNDGKPDILWRDNATGKNVIWLMDGVTMSSYVNLSNVDSSWYVGGAGDFNNDQMPDILWRKPSTSRNTVWYMNGTTYTSFANLPSADSPWEIKSAGVLH